MLPFREPNINSGRNADDVNSFSIWNSQMKICLLENARQLENAILTNDQRRIVYYVGILNCFKYHPRIDSPAIDLIDMLLLQEKWNPHPKGHKKYCKEPQTCCRLGQRELGRRVCRDPQEEKEGKKNKQQQRKSNRIKRRRVIERPR